MNEKTTNGSSGLSLDAISAIDSPEEVLKNFSQWVLAVSNGTTFIGFPLSITSENATVLKPVFQNIAQHAVTPQGQLMSTHLVIPALGLLGVSELEIPKGAVIQKICDLTKEEQAMFRQRVESLVVGLRPAKAAGGHSRIIIPR